MPKAEKSGRFECEVCTGMRRWKGDLYETDRPLIVALASLATGVALIIGYCQGTTSMNVAYPLSGSTLHIDLTTSGPAVLGGFALTALGLLLLAWALLAAIVHQIGLLAGSEDRIESIMKRDREAVIEDQHFRGSLNLTERRHEG